MGLYQNTRTILKSLPLTGDVVPIYTPSLVNHKDVAANQRFTGYLTDLRLKSVINSLDEILLPEFELGQSKTAKMAIVRDLEYNNPRYSLNICLKNTEDLWLSIFEFSLQNRKPFFVTEILGYLTHQPLFTISPDTTLGVQFSDVGYGIPKTGDELILYGSVREEYSTPTPQIIQYFNTGTTDDPVIDIPDEVDMASLLPVKTNLPVDEFTSGTDMIRRNWGYDAINPYATLYTWDALKLAQLNLLIGGSLDLSTELIVTTIPEGFRPTEVIAMPCTSYVEGYEMSFTAYGEITLFINPDGTVKMRLLNSYEYSRLEWGGINVVANLTYSYA